MRLFRFDPLNMKSNQHLFYYRLQALSSTLASELEEYRAEILGHLHTRAQGCI